MMERYKKVGIKAVHFPIHDFNENDLTSKLFEAACKINELVYEQKLNVYIHCTAGMGRAPASLLVYLSLFKRVECWRDPNAVDMYVKSYRKVSVPNMRAVYRIV